jgi:hypothetical protein
MGSTPLPVLPTERQARARLAGLTRAVRAANTRHAELVRRRAELRAELVDARRQWRAARSLERRRVAS